MRFTERGRIINRGRPDFQTTNGVLTAHRAARQGVTAASADLQIGADDQGGVNVACLRARASLIGTSGALHVRDIGTADPPRG